MYDGVLGVVVAGTCVGARGSVGCMFGRVYVFVVCGGMVLVGCGICCVGGSVLFGLGFVWVTFGFDVCYFSIVDYIYLIIFCGVGIFNVSFLVLGFDYSFFKKSFVAASST